jgi:curved DNA-binding protein CbpA
MASVGLSLGEMADPYVTLGVDPGVSDAELRAAYRRLVQLHHPDHNGGSPESARRFEAVQEAYARATALRQRGPAPTPRSDPNVESQLADLERKLRAARQARDAARQAAREASAPRASSRPSDEELGYIKTEDSFSRILADAASEFSTHLSHAREQNVPKRLSDLIDELSAKLSGEPPSR